MHGQTSCPNGCGTVFNRKVIRCPNCGAPPHRLQQQRKDHKEETMIDRRKGHKK